MPAPSGSTTHYGFAYLLESDVPDVATASQDLAVAVDSALYTTNGTVATHGTELTALNTKVGLFGAGGSWVGSTPSVGTPQFLMQAGSPVGVTTSSLGIITVTFPNAFPNGTLAVVATPSVTDGPGFMAFVNAPTKTSASWYVYNQTGSIIASLAIAFSWIAIGY